ncbi:MAG TPA: bifunctional UDP-sugar hydrolase/5'-nucleotidase [Vicinamibacterales bacterium]|nr:bifunctional UDP-sugar hydrolase/5'-nucleotidase [Vicinamibacterales bacterium]
MRPFVRLLLAVLFASAGAVPAATAQSPTLTILHTNDTHGHLMPFSYPETAVATGEPGSAAPRRDIGGIARRATLAERIRKERAAAGGATWLVDIGDYSDGTPFSIAHKGEADVAAMNAAGYDFATLGNHELNYPAAQTRRLVSLTKAQLLCANLTERATGLPLVPPFVIRNVGPVRVGVFGLITRSAASYPAGKEAFAVADEVTTARQVLATLRRQVDVVVLLSHAGEDVDEQLALALPEIDVIVGGHSHSRLPSGRFIWRSEDLRASEVNGTIIVQAHQWGGELGRLDLLFGRDGHGRWRIQRYRSRLLPVTAEVPDHPAVAAVVQKYWAPIAARYGQVVGEAADDFTSRGDDQAEYNLVADAVRETFDAELALENLGGVRAPLVRGPVTRGDLVTMDPFDNTVVRFKATGRQIRQILARHAPAVSGVRYRLQGKDLLEATIGGRPIEDDRVYAGVTNSYFAGFALKGITTEDTGRERLETLVAYIQRQGTIKAAYDGRRIVDRGR